MADVWELAAKEREAQLGREADGQPTGADSEATILVAGSPASVSNPHCMVSHS
jgi:hypothetical protein